jgi:hypothetical protein
VERCTYPVGAGICGEPVTCELWAAERPGDELLVARTCWDHAFDAAGHWAADGYAYVGGPVPVGWGPE